MRPDVHAAALRSAAKLVLGMASFSTLTIACTSEATEESNTNESAVITADTKPEETKAPATAPATGDKKPDAPSACGTLLASTFPDPGHYQWEPVAQSAEVVDCCKQELASESVGTPYRWECCVAFDPAVQEPNTEWPVTVASSAPGFACTPWGPPVPPSMKRKSGRSPARRDMIAFLAQAVA